MDPSCFGIKHVIVLCPTVFAYAAVYAILLMPVAAGLSLYMKWRNGHRTTNVILGILLGTVWLIMITALHLELNIFPKAIDDKLGMLIWIFLFLNVMIDWGIETVRTRLRPWLPDLLVLLLIVCFPVFEYIDLSLQPPEILRHLGE
jgi:hypothetical protein